MNFWNNHRVMVTGGSGFLGSVVVKASQKRHTVDAFVPRKKAYDFLRNQQVATKTYNQSTPVNLRSSFEISIKYLLEMIAKLTGFNGEIHWDTSKPNGQSQRKLDTSRAETFKSSTPFETGLRQTTEWYSNTK